MRVKLGCSLASGTITLGDKEITNRDDLYIYCGATNDLKSVQPSTLEVVRKGSGELLDEGLTWTHRDEYEDGRYAVLAVPEYLGIDCYKMLIGDFTVEIGCENTANYNGYKFYYFSSPITGDFTCKYIFKEENN